MGPPTMAEGACAGSGAVPGDSRTVSVAAHPLAAALGALGARWTTVDGQPTPADFGDPAAEAAALRARVALVDRSWLDRVELTGADRQRFLHGLVTCDVKGLAPPTSAYGFLTTGQGKVFADAVVVALADRLVLELPPGRGEAVREHLGRYVVADRVAIAASPLVAIALVGPGAPVAARAVGAGEAGDGAVVSLAAAGAALWAVHRPIAGLPAVTFLGPEAAVVALVPALAVSASPAGFDALERVRIGAGLPRWGPDFGLDTLPQETGLETAAVSYTKGCYLGQEVVARIHYRGGVQRGFRGLRLAGSAPPPPGTPLLFDGREAGRVGSAARVGDGTVALALVHRRVPTGAAVTLGVEGALGEAQVVELPFAPG